MSDLFEPLRTPTGDPTHPLPPEEVRRRGDRLRRRRTVAGSLAAAAAVAVVVAGGALLTGLPGSERSAGDPAATPSGPGIPADLDLSRDLGDETLDVSPAREDLGVLTRLRVCDAAYSPADLAVDHLGLTWSAPGDRGGRDLSLYPDAATAESAAGDLVAKFEACPEFAVGRVRFTTEVTRGDLGDRSWTVARRLDAPGLNPDYVEVVTVVRVGAAVLVDQRVEGHLNRVQAVVRMANGSVRPVVTEEMCVFGRSGCAG
jgi:hypothetical protein